MKNFYLILLTNVIGIILIGCSSDANNSLENEKFSLISTNNVTLAKSLEELTSSLKNDDEVIDIIDIVYINISNTKNAIAAYIEYTSDGVYDKVLYLRNIESINFEEDTILNFENKLNKDGGVYVSCTGASCCAPYGTFDPNTGIFTTSCLCGGNANNDCVMVLSDKPPHKK